MKDALQITGVAEVVLSVRNLPLMREFYRDVLGFALHSEGCYDQGPEPAPGGEAAISFLTVRQIDTPLGRNGHPQLLALIDFKRHASARKRLFGHEQTTSTLNHLAFEIPPESYEAQRQRLESLGLAPSLSEFPHLAAKALFFQDPEGNQLELTCTIGRVVLREDHRSEP